MSRPRNRATVPDGPRSASRSRWHPWQALEDDIAARDEGRDVGELQGREQVAQAIHLHPVTADVDAAEKGDVPQDRVLPCHAVPAVLIRARWRRPSLDRLDRECPGSWLGRDPVHVTTDPSPPCDKPSRLRALLFSAGAPRRAAGSRRGVFGERFLGGGPGRAPRGKSSWYTPSPRWCRRCRRPCQSGGVAMRSRGRPSVPGRGSAPLSGSRATPCRAPRTTWPGKNQRRTNSPHPRGRAATARLPGPVQVQCLATNQGSRHRGRGRSGHGAPCYEE